MRRSRSASPVNPPGGREAPIEGGVQDLRPCCPEPAADRLSAAVLPVPRAEEWESAAAALSSVVAATGLAAAPVAFLAVEGAAAPEHLA